MANKIIIVQGGQYGSEAKGQIAAIIAEREGVHIAVRTGATNAGHTVYFQGQPVKMQQLPTAWVVPGVRLVIGAGALIDPEILTKEVALVSSLTGEDIRERLLIDYRAGLHTQEHAERSKASGRHHAIGATGKGCSEALIDRIRLRGKGYTQYGNSVYAKGFEVVDTERYLNSRFDAGEKIMLEGTQGTMLDLYLGPYPYTTHKQTGPGQWMLEAGLSPALPTDIVSVIRTYPIRVAGNSGPLPMETSWPILARRINQKRELYRLPPVVAEWAIRQFEAVVGPDNLNQHLWHGGERELYQSELSEANAEAMKKLSPETVTELSKLFEFTTVTKKLRRVAPASSAQLYESWRMTRPHRIALTFMNYEFPQWWYNAPQTYLQWNQQMHEYVSSIQSAAGAPVTYVGFGPESKHHVTYRR